MKNSILCVLLWIGLTSAAIINVPTDQATIQEGINAAVSGDTVLVANGTYYESINYQGKAITVASHYAVDGDTLHILNTTIDGSQLTDEDRSSVVYFESGEDTTSVLMGLTITGGKGSKTGGTVFGKKINGGGILCKNSSARIVHNIIRNNSAIGKQESGGGGLYASAAKPSEHFLILEHNQFLRNGAESAQNDAAGGGVWTDINSRVLHNTFIENSSMSETGSYGAAVAGGGYANEQCLFSFCHNRIEGNACTTNRQDGISFGAVITMFDSNVFQENVFLANKNLGSSYARAAALTVFKADSSTLIKNNHFKGNISKGDSQWGAALFVDQSSNVLTEDNVSEENVCDFAPGLYYFFSNGIIRNNRIISNEALRHIGGLCTYKSDILIDANIISENQSNGGAGGVWLNDSKGIMQNNFVLFNAGKYAPGIGVFKAPPQAGSALEMDYCDAATAREIVHKPSAPLSLLDIDMVLIINNTVYHNAGTYGGGLYTILANTVAINNIFYANKASSQGNAQIYNEGGNLAVAYNLVQHGWEGEGNIDADPHFADSTFHLSDSSACIGAGTSAFTYGGSELLCPENDCMNNLRPNPVGSNPDLGAFEHELATPVAPDTIDTFVSWHSLPLDFSLKQNYPNPFNPITTLSYTVPQPGRIKLSIYNVNGRLVRTLVDEEQSAGVYATVWDAADDTGAKVSSGIYLYRIQIVDPVAGREAWRAERKMVLLK